MKQYLFPLLVVSLLSFAPKAFAAEHTKDSLDKVKTSVAEKKALLVDVRELSEWKAGHLAAAKLVPLSALPDNIKQGTLEKKLPKDKIIYCHCRSGRRCLRAADLLKKAGYDVRPLKPGYEDLLKAGFEKAKK